MYLYLRVKICSAELNTKAKLLNSDYYFLLVFDFTFENIVKSSDGYFVMERCNGLKYFICDLPNKI